MREFGGRSRAWNFQGPRRAREPLSSSELWPWLSL
jgi:hypothetical protein